MSIAYYCIIYQIEDNDTSLKEFEERLRRNESEKVQDIILNYPTGYLHNWQKTNEYEVYIDESNHVIQRTKQHYMETGNRNTWQYQMKRNKARLFLIGHEHFNKSRTLDIENRFIHYMMGIDKVKKIHNLRVNPQNRYYPDNELDDIFRDIWTILRKENPDLFPAESLVRDSAVFKASPLHKLTPEQEKAKELMIQQDIMERAKVTVVMFNKNQILTTEQFVGGADFGPF